MNLYFPVPVAPWQLKSSSYSRVVLPQRCGKIYTLQTIGYMCDAASRVLDADYYQGENTASTPVEAFAYEYDVAGNLTDNNGTAASGQWHGRR